MAVLIPIIRNVDDSSRFDQQVSLDGANYVLRFDWNVRDNFWYVVILSEDGLTVLTPQTRIVVNYFLGKFISNRNPAGCLIAIDGNSAFNQGQPPGFDDLGSRVQLFYLSADEL